jgi:hypothetical protein
MLRRSAALALALVAATGVAPGAAVREAAAGDNNLVLSRLTQLLTDGDGNPVAAVGQNLEFRALMSELGVVMAPRMLAPSDTLGFGGFQFSADMGFTSVSGDKSWWRVLESSPDPTGGDGVQHGSDTMATLGLFVRKGMWFPVPSSEIAVGFVHLADSDLWMAQAYAKVALHEGYHALPVPSVAVRGGVSRLMGTSQVDLTVASVDVSVSKQLGIGGTWTLSPYGGWNTLIVIPRSEVLDATPHIDSLAPGNEADSALNFVFKDQDNIVRNRVFLGAKLQYYVFQLSLEAAFALAGGSSDDRGSTTTECTLMSTTSICDSPDLAAGQRTFSASLGLDF